MKTYLFKTTLFLVLLANHSQAKTYMLHATGIDSGNSNQNYNEFYMNAQRFKDVCNSNPNEYDCSFYINTNKNYMENPSLNFNLYGSKGSPTKQKILNDFYNMIANPNLKPGDQVVFSLDDHGVNFRSQSSCVMLDGSTGEKICASDVEQVLKYKNPNVKIFLKVEACFSGAWTKHISKDVCTFTTADAERVGHVYGFWNEFARVKNYNRGPMSIKQLSESLKRTNVFTNRRTDGANFGSDYISQELCDKGEQSTSNLNEILTEDSVEIFRDIQSYLNNAKSVLNNSCKEELPYKTDVFTLLNKFNYDLSEGVENVVSELESAKSYLKRCISNSYCKDKFDFYDTNAKDFQDFINLIDEIAGTDKYQLQFMMYYDQELGKAIKSTKSKSRKATFENMRAKNLIQYKTKYQEILDKIENSNLIKRAKGKKLEECFQKRDFEPIDKKYIQRSADEVRIPVSFEKLDEAKECENSFVFK